MKVPIAFDEMFDNEKLSLAKRCIRELNKSSLEQYKVVKK